MKFLQTFFFVCLISLILHFSIQYTANSEWAKQNKILIEEVTRLRAEGARKTYAKAGRGLIDKEAIAVTSKAIGTPAWALAGIRGAENGPPFYEMGNKGKTDWIALNFPLEQVQYLEAGRTWSVLVGQWMERTPEGREALRSMLPWFAKAYTGHNNQSTKDWIKAFKKYSKNLKDVK